MDTFDAPSRESCVVRRERTNTPLQALLLMNDPQYVEASRHLAQRAISSGGEVAKERAEYLFQLAALRSPDAEELAELLAVFQDRRAFYSDHVDDAKQLL